MFTQLVSHSPWYVYLICLLLAGGFTALLYFRNPSNKELPRFALLTLQFSRFFSSLLILILLSDFYFKHIRNETERPLVILMQDNSASIVSGNDSLIIKARLEGVLKEFEEKLGKRYELSSYLFASGLVPFSGKTEYKEKETDLDNALSELEGRYSNRNVGAVILISDGIYNKGANPLYRAEHCGFPVYTLALGDTVERKDVLLQKVLHNQVAYLGNAFQVELHVMAWKYKGRKTSVKILQNSVIKARAELNFSSDPYSGQVTFTLNAGEKGLNHYQAEIELLEDEKNKVNNRLDFTVEVLDNREKILLLAQAPHPDVAALRESILSNSAYELESFYYPEFRSSLKAYSLVILQGPGGLQRPLIDECRNSNIPFLIVNPAATDLFPGMRVNGSINRFNDAEALVNPNFDLFRQSDELKSFLNNCPAVKTAFGNYLLSNSANPLLFQKIGHVETDQPLLVFNDYSGAKSACFTGDGLWKWKMRDFAEHGNHQLFNELIFSTVQYLAVKNDKSFFRLKAPRTVNENEEVEMDAEVYNKSYELISNSQVELELINSKNKSFKYGFSSNGRYYHANLGQLSPGEYKYRATAKSGNDVYQKSGQLLVKELSAEKMNTVADHRLLYQIARRSGANAYPLSESAKLFKDLSENDNLKSVTYSKSSLTQLIEWLPVFWILLFSLTLEWWIRKRYLSI